MPIDLPSLPQRLLTKTNRYTAELVRILYKNIANTAGAGGGSNIFTYKPGYPSSGNTYATWAETHAARQAYVGSAIIEVDYDWQTTAEDVWPIIPAEGGPWDMTNTLLRGRYQPVTGGFIYLETNSPLPGLVALENIQIDYYGASPLLSSDQLHLNLQHSSIITHIAGGIWDIPDGGSDHYVTMYDGSMIQGSGLDPDKVPFLVGAGPNLLISLYTSSSTSSALADGSGAVAIGVYDLTVGFDDNQWNTQPVAYYFVTSYCFAEKLGFYGEPGHWQAPAPENTSNALTRLAAGAMTYITFIGAFLPAAGATMHAPFAGGSAVNLTSGFTETYPPRNLVITRGNDGEIGPVSFMVAYTNINGQSFTDIVSVARNSSGVLSRAGTIASVTTTQDPGATTFTTGNAFSVGNATYINPEISVDGVMETATVHTYGWLGTVHPVSVPNGTRNYMIQARLSPTA